MYRLCCDPPLALSFASSLRLRPHSARGAIAASIAVAAPQWTAPITVAQAPNGSYVNLAAALSADGAPITLTGLLTNSGIAISAVTQRQQGLVTEQLPSLTGDLQPTVGFPFSLAPLPHRRRTRDPDRHGAGGSGTDAPERADAPQQPVVGAQ